MLFSTTAVAVFGLATLGQSHMMMSYPVPYGKSTLDNSPLVGPASSTMTSDFPCKQRAGVYDAEGANNIMPLGSVQNLTFVGSAVHGGGSCQISITYDSAPTVSSTWKVIHSIVGGCPAKNTAGNLPGGPSDPDPFTYSFTVPSNLPTGTATLAWTWFNRIGNREMYMNCAPITLTGGAAKRSEEDEDLMRRSNEQLAERDAAAYSALPEMFVANIPGSGCSTTENFDLAFPNPGDSVESFSFYSTLAPTGTACGTAIQATGTAPTSSGAAHSVVISATASHSASIQATTAASSPGQGGVFVTVAKSATSSSGATVTPVATSVSASATAAAVPTTLVTSSVAPVATGTTGTGSAFAAGSPCTTEGEWNCIGGTQFQQCASGTWSVVQAVAAGTKCTGGESMAMGISATKLKSKKRGIRFSNAHVRRHVLS